MIKKIIFILILFFNVFVIKSNCQAFNLNDNNLAVPSVNSNMNDQNVQDIISKTQQLESKIENDKNAKKAILDQKKAEYAEAKKNYNYANKQFKAVHSINKKLQKNF